MSTPSSPRTPGSPGSEDAKRSTASTVELSIAEVDLDATSLEVQAFVRLFDQLSDDHQTYYLREITKYISTKIQDRLKENGVQKKEDVMNTCFKKIFTGIWARGDCVGLRPDEVKVFFQGFAEFLHNFTFPPVPKGGNNTLSLPMLEFVAILRYRASAIVDKCIFDMETVDWTSFTDIDYEANAYVAADTTPANVEHINNDSLLAFLTKIGVVNHGQHVRFNLGKINKPSKSEMVPSQSKLDSSHVSLYFIFNHNILRAVIDKHPSTDGSRECKFMIDEVFTGGVINRWTWRGKINNLKFYYTCTSSPQSHIGGRSRRRPSKTKKVRARTTHRRRNIKKLKHSVYVKTGNTKRKLRRVRH